MDCELHGRIKSINTRISDYNILEKLGESLHTEVFKVCPNDHPNRILVLKRFKSAVIASDFSTRLKFQTDYLKHLNIPGLIKPVFYSFEKEKSFLIREYFSGITLGNWMKYRGRISLSDFFKIACVMAELIDNIHKAGYVHGGIKPGNILIKSNALCDTHEIRLIDPVRLININDISCYLYDDDFRINTLYYISPEQTGRIKQQVDYSTDFYSLGIVLYELLNGSPPFESQKPLEVIHSHLAETPRHLFKLNPDIPEIIGDIIARLMIKEPEKRYQTGAGLLHDLIRCRDEYLIKREISSFSLGLSDHSGKITVSSIMVGRDAQKELLFKEHKLSCNGEFRAVIISGLPGIGKTRLILELEKPVITRRGYFTSGKFDQYQKNVPYSTLIQAFRSLIDLFLTESADRIEYWKKTITEALGTNGKLITDLIPKLELIIGAQPKVAVLPPTESINRFNDLLESFISCLARPEHPLTLFIDDLQWCDNATFEIIENILINSKNYPYLFFLGAYRHNVVDHNHPLSNILERVRGTKNPLTEIRINELEPAHTNLMIADILDVSPDRTSVLTEFLNEASIGNPLNVHEILTWLYENNLIYQGKGGDWQWDTEKIVKSSIPESAEELFRSKILKISEDSLKVLQIAACLGASFRIEDLSMVTGKDQAELYKELAPVFSKRILVKKKDLLTFFHDRVQEAVDSTLDVKMRRAIHSRIAKTYIEAIPDKSDLDALDNLFSVVDHLNKGRADIPNSSTLYRDAVFNYHAGRKAVDALALEAANKYFRESKALIPEKYWEADYHFLFSLYKELAKSELTLGNQSKAKELLNKLIEKSKTDLDRAECLAEQSTNLLSLGKFKQSILVANQGLAYFGKAVPEDEADVMLKTDNLAAAIKKTGVSPHEILEKEPIAKKDKLIEITLYNQLIPAYYLSGQSSKLFLTGLQAAHLCLHIGIHDQSIYPFGIYSAYLLEIGRYEDAFSFEDLVQKLCNRFPNSFGATRGMNCVAWLTLHWRNSLSDVFNYSLKAIQSGKNSGDTHHAGFAYCASVWTAVMKGGNLKTTAEYVVECKKFSKKYNISLSSGMAGGMLAAWIDPMKDAGNGMPMQEDIAGWLRSNDFALLGNYYIFSAMAQFYLGNFKNTACHLKNGGKYLTGHISNIPNRIWHIFFVLNSLRLLEKNPSEHKIDAVMTEIKPVIEKIKLWAGFGPALKPYLAFIKAEVESVKNIFSETRRLYLDAIDIAHKQEYTLLEGHIHETLGKLLSGQEIDQAYYHIKRAAYLYDRCNADAMLMLIRQRYPRIFSKAYEERPEEIPLVQNLDAEYLMKAAMTIYQKLDIDELLMVIMKLLMERSGANEGYLLMEKGADLITRVKGKKEKHISVILTKKLLSEETGLSHAMARYVRRTKKTLILENAAEKGPYSSNIEVMELKLASVFIHPIILQKEFIGLICLQNNLIKSAFIEEQVDIVKQLASHAAVAMENTRYRDYLKTMVKERTKELDKANEDLKDFAYIVSHDLKAPIRGISQLAGWLMEDYAHAFDENGKEQMNMLMDRTKRMHDMIDGILRYSRIGRTDSKVNKVDLNLLVNEIIEIISPPENIQIAIINKLPDVYGDETAIYQVFQNFLDNAVKYMDKPEGRIFIDYDSDDGNWRFFVSDNGPGIEDRHRKKIFQLFQTLRPKDKTGSTGIGLSLVKKIVNNWGGSIRLESEVGKGSKFVWTMPKMGAMDEKQQTDTAG